MKRYGLLGKVLTHSFSKKYFTEKFENSGLNDHSYELYEIPVIEDFPTLVENIPGLCGLNVTIPYKEQVIPFLHSLDDSASEIGAVNVIKIDSSGNMTGYNSDFFGFRQSLLNFSAETGFPLKNTKALVLGTGGASKAAAAALRNMNIPFKTVSREKDKADFTYETLNAAIIDEHLLIVNASPIGTYPKTEEAPAIPYPYLSSSHLLFDLVYNPAETLFMKKGLEKGAYTKNGLEMLTLQAEKAWEIWNS